VLTVIRRSRDRRASNRPTLVSCPQCGAVGGAVILARTVRRLSVRCEQCHEHWVINKPSLELFRDASIR
jgi:transcription elongation factor Elf1